MKPPIGNVPRASWYAAGIAVISLLLCLGGGIVNPTAFFQAWLINWMFLLGISLASMMLLMIHELTGGEWGNLLRAPLVSAMLLIPLVAILAIPLAGGLPDLFPWAHAGVHEPIIQKKEWYLNIRGFLIRNGTWFLIWSLFAVALSRQFRQRISRPNESTRPGLSIAGLLFYLFTITLVAFDWISSLVPEWYSSIIGVRLGAGQFIAAFAFGAPFAVRFAARVPAKKRHQDFQDFGNLLLTFSMFWGYIVFMQYLIVWGEDQPHEIAWYWPRTQTTWRMLALPLIALNFVLPVCAMLFRAIKTNAFRLQIVCYLALAGQWLDTLWLLAPSWRRQGFEIHWMDLCALLAEGGLWFSFFTAIMSRSSRLYRVSPRTH